jgi:hypothetical protein
MNFALVPLWDSQIICNLQQGPLAKPPVPITTSGLKSLIIRFDFHKLFSLKGNIAFFKLI